MNLKIPSLFKLYCTVTVTISSDNFSPLLLSFKYFNFLGRINALSQVYDFSPAGLMKLQHLYSLVNGGYSLDLRAVKRILTVGDAHEFLRGIELADKESKKYVILDCDSDTARTIIVNHVRDIYVGRRNFHFLLTSLVRTTILYYFSMILT